VDKGKLKVYRQGEYMHIGSNVGQLEEGIYVRGTRSTEYR
jgi:hypothetical protein